ncbi:vacuolar protein sorting-associated protein 11 homolog [Condylostylus longicornis]|uniref:vacuolar protein sorting-associated protein 11 homolog n=1 Tax=Condylostylus longicornis TaxID=2530218 RepID=UPI00244DC179|nr:vacuolar protein sorting-associated protein 11 homolog [Condylostylus longicornis]
MASFEWRRVNLFDLKPDENSTKITAALQGSQVTCYASGRGQNIICDSQGGIHVFGRNWEFTSFKGHDMSINLCALSIQNNLLVTISGEEINEVFKVWNLSKITKNCGAPCLRKVTAELLQKPTALAVTDNGQIMAIGYELGYISLYRGDIGRDNTKILKKFKCSKSAIVGIAFQLQEKNINMFVCSDTCIVVYNLKSKDKEIKTVLDENCSPTRCYALQNHPETGNELSFIVGRDDAIYCFNKDGRGPCYVLEGQKSLVECFRTGLIVISKITKTTTDKQSLSVIDIQDNIIIFNCNINEVVAIFKEFGVSYILTKNNELFRLCEKDFQSKLNVLFKKNQYEVAVKVATREQYDPEGLAGIYKQYGDHLYIKRDYEGAVENYIKTIGYLEPSYVTRKFLDSKHTKFLTDYLLALHKNRKAVSYHHTTLLLNCLTRLELKEELTDFLAKDTHPDITFDIEEAIKICRKASIELALELSKRNQKHQYCVTILIEDLALFEEALDYISKLSFSDSEKLLIKYGIVLMNNCPDRTTNVLKKLCMFQKDQSYEISNSSLISFKSADFGKFFKSFFKNTDKLIDFLEHIIQNVVDCIPTPEVLNTLIELYLRKVNESNNVKDRLIEIFLQFEGIYDVNHVLILCRLYNFSEGIVWIYEQNKLYHLVLRYHLENRNYKELLKFCKRNGSSEPSLWLEVLNSLENDEQAPSDLLVLVLNNIYTSNEKPQSPLQILNYLVSKDKHKNIKLGNVRDYFSHVFRKESQLTNQEKVTVKNLQINLEVIKGKIENICSKPVEFRNTMCDSCHQRLTMPVTYFLCKHAFHQECLINSDSEKDCKICLEGYSQLNNALKAQSESKNTPNEFHKELINSHEPFSVVSEYFGRGLFNEIVVINEEDEPKEIISKETQQNIPISEAKLRLAEGRIKDLQTNYITQAEARIRAEEAYRYAKTEKKEVKFLPKKSVQKLDKISKSLSKSESTNPFDVDGSDHDFSQQSVHHQQKPISSKNQSTNPFEIDEMESARPRRNIRSIELYNNNLNPFA